MASDLNLDSVVPVAGCPAYLLTAILRGFQQKPHLCGPRCPPSTRSVHQAALELHQQAATALGLVLQLHALLQHLLDASNCHLCRRAYRKEAMFPASFWATLRQGVPCGLYTAVGQELQAGDGHCPAAEPHCWLAPFLTCGEDVSCCG